MAISNLERITRGMDALKRGVAFLILRLRGVVAAPVIDAVRQLAPVPKLFISGAGQDLEREAVRRTFAAASEPKTLWEIPEGSHAYTWAARPQEYTQHIVDFFAQALSKGVEDPGGGDAAQRTRRLALEKTEANGSREWRVESGE